MSITEITPQSTKILVTFLFQPSDLGVSPMEDWRLPVIAPAIPHCFYRIPKSFRFAGHE
jgi:hypothetical protein